MFESVLPVIVPRTYFQFGNWPGRYLLLRHPDLAVTWVELTRPEWMNYVNYERQREIEQCGFGIHSIAMANLHKQSEKHFTHARTDGDRIVFQAMMHEDGLGTSRLLLLPGLNAPFATGYLVAIPERSCGFVVPKGLPPSEHDEVLQMITRCHRYGTIPMLPGLHEPDLFAVADEQPTQS
jgi:hypothetical protein